MITNESPSSQEGWSDEKVDNLIGTLLRAGVIIAAAMVLLGGIPYLIANARVPIHYGTFQGQPHSLTSVRGILRSALALDSRSIIQLGLVLLIATPVARVALSLFAFAKQHDRTYVIITAIVLTILLWSLTGGKGL